MIFELYNKFFDEVRDKRSENYFLASKPPTLWALILIGYVILVRKGPKWMENRKPFELKSTIMVYNIFQVIANTLLFSAMFNFVFIKYDFNFSCQPVIYDANEQGLESLNLAYSYFLLKMVDLLDTVFIVLKKKNSQLSSLHCYHHFLMAFSMYFAVLTIPGGSPMLMGMINSFVHSCMYSYYFLATLNPKIKISVWKKRLTQIQLVQFGINVNVFLRVVLSPDCGFPKLWIWFLFFVDLAMLVMFGNFYRRTYLKKE